MWRFEQERSVWYLLTLTPVLCIFFQDLVSFEKQWSGFFSSMDLESHLSILELSEAQAGEVRLIPRIPVKSKTTSGEENDWLWAFLLAVFWGKSKWIILNKASCHTVIVAPGGMIVVSCLVECKWSFNYLWNLNANINLNFNMKEEVSRTWFSKGAATWWNTFLSQSSIIHTLIITFLHNCLAA